MSSLQSGDGDYILSQPGVAVGLAWKTWHRIALIKTEEDQKYKRGRQHQPNF